MEEKKYKVLSIGAHPDDADTSDGGLLRKLQNKGWEVRLVSMTDGSAGHYDTSLAGGKLAEIRKVEAAKSGRVFGGRYDVFDNPDGRLEVTLANREYLIRYIREYNPDLIITNRLNDYHPDHRNTAQLVQDASYLLTVPCLYPDCKAMEHMPVILYWHDSFRLPYPIHPDIIVPVDDTMEACVEAACCHECQYFDWMYWPDQMERRDWPREKQIEVLAQRFESRLARYAQEYAPQLKEKFGKDAAGIGHIEIYEISEYGEEPTPELMEILEK